MIVGGVKNGDRSVNRWHEEKKSNFGLIECTVDGVAKKSSNPLVHGVISEGPFVSPQ